MYFERQVLAVIMTGATKTIIIITELKVTFSHDTYKLITTGTDRNHLLYAESWVFYYVADMQK